LTEKPPAEAGGVFTAPATPPRSRRRPERAAAQICIAPEPPDISGEKDNHQKNFLLKSRENFLSDHTRAPAAALTRVGQFCEDREQDGERRMATTDRCCSPPPQSEVEVNDLARWWARWGARERALILGIAAGCPYYRYREGDAAGAPDWVSRVLRDVFPAAMAGILMITLMIADLAAG
jgi:hypothetical protein